MTTPLNLNDSFGASHRPAEDLTFAKNNMDETSYTGEWNEDKVAAYLLGRTEYSCWLVSDDGTPYWITNNGERQFMMDDDDDRWNAIKRFINERGTVTRSELYKEFRYRIWQSESQ